MLVAFSGPLSSSIKMVSSYTLGQGLPYTFPEKKKKPERTDRCLLQQNSQSQIYYRSRERNRHKDYIYTVQTKDCWVLWALSVCTCFQGFVLDNQLGAHLKGRLFLLLERQFFSFLFFSSNSKVKGGMENWERLEVQRPWPRSLHLLWVIDAVSSFCIWRMCSFLTHSLSLICSWFTFFLQLSSFVDRCLFLCPNLHKSSGEGEIEKQESFSQGIRNKERLAKNLKQENEGVIIHN